MRISRCYDHRSNNKKRSRWQIGIFLCSVVVLSSSDVALVDGLQVVGLPTTLCSRRHIRDYRHEPPSRRYITRCSQQHENEEIEAVIGDSSPCYAGKLTRRQALLLAVASTTALIPTLSANAAKPELDSSGVLFSPRPEMLSGGSVATRGIPVSGSRKYRLQPGQNVQSIYETRFVAYLSRFLLNFDNAARAWWMKQGLADSWEGTADVDPTLVENTFAEFAESVEIGLADYFSGPFGSYSSVSAAAAGISAAQQAKSVRPDSTTTSSKSTTSSFLDKVTGRTGRQAKKETDNLNLARQGILNLCALLKARYNTLAAKRQLAILFSFITSPYLQPTSEISSLLGEADNATVTQIELVRTRVKINNEANARDSPHRGGGYFVGSFPKVTVASPPPLGDKYTPAEAEPIMRSTSRILKITLLDGGEGYTRAPQVFVRQLGATRQCQAAAILDRTGHVDSILVLDPGYGYGGAKGETPPSVYIEAPEILDKKNHMQRRETRRARAVAWMEYEVVGIHVIRGGNGYVSTEPPTVSISPPPEDPDWFLNIQEQPELRMMPVANNGVSLRGQVTEMKFADGNVAYSLRGVPSRRMTRLDDTLIERLQRDPLELLPSSIRPETYNDAKSKKQIYLIEPLVGIPQYVAVMSPLYRACDPVFGGVGRVPVTKGATELRASEYARLALSGAVCTVIVRTLLNPLELIKTKQQLGNDDELFRYAQDRFAHANAATMAAPTTSGGLPAKVALVANHTTTSTTAATSTEAQPTSSAVAVAVRDPPLTLQMPEVRVDPPKVKIGTLELTQSLVELRGPMALFQSADITFLASLVFGSFGFGATELFRRSFQQLFAQPGNDGAPTSSTMALLLAAALATVVTAAVATPFEVLRVRSMGMVEAVKWPDVLQDYLDSSRGHAMTTKYNVSDWSSSVSTNGANGGLKFAALRPRDLVPLWSGFVPTLSRELPFAVAKFLAFDTLARLFVDLLNRQAGAGALPIQVGVGPVGLTVSAAAGALAGIAGAVVSHPADLILTKTSASRRRRTSSSLAQDDDDNKSQSTQQVIKELIQKEGGLSNLFVGLGARATFFFLVIGFQFFLYDYANSLLQVGSDDLKLVLDVFYAVRAGLVETMQQDSGL